MNIPKKPFWYETFLKAAEERFHRENAERNIALNRHSGRGVLDAIEIKMWYSVPIAINHDTLVALGFDDPYKQ